MPRYRKRPVVIDAIQWTGHNYPEVIAFIGAEAAGPTADQIVQIQTLEGVMTASMGDWIIRGVQGEHYPCKADIFEATYESAEDAA